MHVDERFSLKKTFMIIIPSTSCLNQFGTLLAIKMELDPGTFHAAPAPAGRPAGSVSCSLILIRGDEDHEISIVNHLVPIQEMERTFCYENVSDSSELSKWRWFFGL